jgi:hypothetical protein
MLLTTVSHERIKHRLIAILEKKKEKKPLGRNQLILSTK